ncbi:Putative Arv1 protein [Colletotrichum destructivum]|uniref:Protein ARV n=1 Tax=Colletotrichum destructivum TaxID=34406 RepID=A0AAX4I9W8_9PEZI|nr:Putative Arv1 protein [Colletotrichum destructivum]
MPICIECRHPVKTLWTKYSNADDKSSGHNIRLTVCRNCGHFCDKYVEHDFVVLFIDLVLIKPQVYRHLLHNTLMKDDDQFDSSIVRLGVLLLLFDVYLTWARIEKQTVPKSSQDEGANLGSLTQQSIVSQYLFFCMLDGKSNFFPPKQRTITVPGPPQARANIALVILCALSTLAFHMSIRFMTSSFFSPLGMFNVLPRYSRPNSVSTALLVSSSTKLFPILMVIWQYDVPAAARSLGWAVVANNVEALRILLDCGYGVATLLATTGALARWAVGRGVLWAAGMDGIDSIGETSIAADGKALWALLMYVREWASDLAAG